MWVRIRERGQYLCVTGGGEHVHGWHKMTSGARYHRVMTCFVSDRFKASTGRGGMRPATAGGAAPDIPPGTGAGNDDWPLLVPPVVSSAKVICRWLCSVWCCRLRESLNTWSLSLEGSAGLRRGPRFSSPSSFTSTSSISHSASRSMSAWGSSRDPLLWRCCKGLSWGELAATSRATTSGLTTRDKPKSAILTEQSTQDTRMFAAAERTWSQSRKWVRRDEIRQQQPGKGPANDMNIESRHWLG